LGNLVQVEVEGEDVYARFAEEAKGAWCEVGGDEVVDGDFAHVPGLGYMEGLEVGGVWGDVGVEARG
jgi:hypothetical protein